MISTPALRNAPPGRLRATGPRAPRMTYTLSGVQRRIEVLVEPLCNRGPQSEMELDFIAIQGTPVPQWRRIRFALCIQRAEFHRILLDAILIARGAISWSDPEIAQAREHDPLLLQNSS